MISCQTDGHIAMSLIFILVSGVVLVLSLAWLVKERLRPTENYRGAIAFVASSLYMQVGGWISYFLFSSDPRFNQGYQPIQFGTTGKIIFVSATILVFGIIAEWTRDHLRRNPPSRQPYRI